MRAFTKILRLVALALLVSTSSGCALFWMLIEGSGAPTGPCSGTCVAAFRDGGNACADEWSEYSDLVSCACGGDACYAECGATLCEGKATPLDESEPGLSPHVGRCESCIRRNCLDERTACVKPH
jgi:hypothetical protein